MNANTRKLASVLTTAATVVVGIIGARAINNDDSGSAKADDSTAAIVVDADSVVETAVSSTETSASGDSGGGVPVGDAAEGLMFVDDPISGPYALPDRAFDRCAGAAAGAAAAANCPVGYAGLLGGAPLPPPPFVWGTPGRYLSAPSAPFPEACPSSTPAGEDHNAITVFSRTPLVSLTVKWRRYGAESDPWVPLVAPATSADDLMWWQRRFEANEGWDRSHVGFLTLCGIHIDRDPNVPYEVVLDAVDSFGQPVTSRPFVMHDGTPSGRPPTQAYIIGDFAYIDGWAPASGSVTFATRLQTGHTIEDIDDYGGIPPDDVECPTAGEGVVASTSTRDDQVFVSPLGVYDPTFTRKTSTWIQLPVSPTLFCTTIYDSSGAAIATDIHLIQGADRKVPVLTLTTVDLEGADIAAGDLRVRVGDAGYDCGPEWTLDEDLSGAVRNFYFDYFDVRWTCPALPNDTTFDLYVYVDYRRSGTWLSGVGVLSLETDREGRSRPAIGRIALPRPRGGICVGPTSNCRSAALTFYIDFPFVGVPGGAGAYYIGTVS